MKAGASKIFFGEREGCKAVFDDLEKFKSFEIEATQAPKLLLFLQLLHSFVLVLN